MYNPALYSVQMKAVPRHDIFCPHCNSMLPKSYYRHLSLYYNVTSQQRGSAKVVTSMGKSGIPSLVRNTELHVHPIVLKRRGI